MPTNPIVHILEQIHALTFQNVSHFIAHLLSIDTPELQVYMEELKMQECTQLILEALSLYGSHETIMSWAVEQSCTLFKHEVLRASNVESGLHFNASNACSADILNFDLMKIACTFKHTAPSLWGVIQTLLDANKTVRRWKVPVGATSYDGHHELADDLNDNMVHEVESDDEELIDEMEGEEWQNNE